MINTSLIIEGLLIMGKCLSIRSQLNFGFPYNGVSTQPFKRNNIVDRTDTEQGPRDIFLFTVDIPWNDSDSMGTLFKAKCSSMTL